MGFICRRKKGNVLDAFGRRLSLSLLGICITGCSLAGLPGNARIFGLHGAGSFLFEAASNSPGRPMGHPGDLADLRDDKFSAARGKSGYWSPGKFLKDVGANIYALEEYDPAKTPILFVHGAAGSPQDWRHFFSHIDRNHYQPWFFYYPSGAPVSTMSELLRQKLFEIQAAYSPAKIHITAHSQGGLIVRSLLADYGDFLPRVKLFISLSTPWGGERFAELGARLSSAVPSWKDLRPGGLFLKTLFRKPLPAEVEYYLFFGHHGSRSVARPNNDGTITLRSLLRQEAQTEARRIYGFDESHASILSSPEVMASYNALLQATDSEVDTAAIAAASLKMEKR